MGFRPVLPEVVAEFADNYPKIFWSQVNPKFFGDGGIFDDIQARIAKST
ncbi:MAG TPA: hypothetical protein VE956_07385 [Nodularia sp. (in: cyanobacteria)]|nr:hypothetical protein [Nodularia sp. (in: cyanobacteria)]